MIDVADAVVMSGGIVAEFERAASKIMVEAIGGNSFCGDL